MDFDDLPDGWAVATIEETGEYINGFAFKPTDWKDQGIPIIRIQNLTSTAKEFNYTDKTIDQKYLIKDQDILVSWSATLGAFMWRGQDAYLNQHIFKVIPNTNLINKNFLYHLLNIVIGEIINGEHLHGSTMKHINRKPFLSHPVLIPPLNEQKRIVEKIESIQERTKIVKSELENVKILLKKFRRSLLASAFRGDLTKDWRANHPDIEPAEVLLERIKTERFSKINKATELKKLESIYSYQENSACHNIPNCWKYFTLEKLCQSFDYGTSAKSSKTGKVAVLRMGNLQKGEIDWSDLVYTSDHEEISKYYLSPLTVLFNRTNSPELVGKTSIYLGEYPAIFAGYLIRIKNLPELNPKYLNYWLNTDIVKIWCSEVKTDGVNQSNINAQKLAKFQIPFCSLAEQEEIVRKLEKMMKFADRVEEQVKQAEEKLNKFNQSLLAKAFKGKLVPQDPNDQPASILLAKIQQEKNKTTGKKTQK